MLFYEFVSDVWFCNILRYWNNSNTIFNKTFRTITSSLLINHKNLLSDERVLKFLHSLLILSKNCFLTFSKFLHSNKKCFSSSTDVLQREHFLSSILRLKYLPFSIFKLWSLSLNFAKNFLCSWVPILRYGSCWYIFLKVLYVLNLLPTLACFLLSFFNCLFHNSINFDYFTLFII